jgi:GGDEF domain-containing protein
MVVAPLQTLATRRLMATSESTRARRFALPDLEDERAESSIQAFLDGPEIRRRRPPRPEDGAVSDRRTGDGSATGSLPGSAAPAVTPGRTRRGVELRSLPGRLEWNAALERESLRARRYGRPASVAIVEIRHERPGMSVEPWLRTLTGPISRALREESRSTDLVARVASTRFQLLLPETNEAGAERLAMRLAGRCREQLRTTAAPVLIRVSVAGTGAGDSLEDALRQALRSIEAA